jgi:hypothetical protein
METDVLIPRSKPTEIEVEVESKAAENARQTMQWAKTYHERTDRHGRASRLSQIILGGQDGIVNTLGLLLGLVAADSSQNILLAGGLAATFAESISMMAVEYTSLLADRSFYKSEIEREKRHIQNVPSLERDEIREIYRNKGYSNLLFKLGCYTQMIINLHQTDHV